MTQVTDRLTRDQIDRVLGDHFLHERNRDVDGVLGTLTEDAAHEVVGDPAGVLFGRAACRIRYEDVYRNLTVERVDVFEFRDGLISRETLWIDSASVVAQLG